MRTTKILPAVVVIASIVQLVAERGSPDRPKLCPAYQCAKEKLLRGSKCKLPAGTLPSRQFQEYDYKDRHLPYNEKWRKYETWAARACFDETPTWGNLGYVFGNWYRLMHVVFVIWLPQLHPFAVVRLIWLTLYLPLNVISSVLNLAVMNKMMKGGTSSIVFHTSEIIADFLSFFGSFLNVMALTYIISAFFPRHNMKGFGDLTTPIGDHFAAALVNCSMLMAHTFCCLLLADRMTALSKPVLYKTYGKKRNAYIVVGISCVFCLIVSFFKIVAYSVAYKRHEKLTTRYQINTYLVPEVAVYAKAETVTFAVLIFLLVTGQIVSGVIFLLKYRAFLKAKRTNSEEEEEAKREEFIQKCRLLVGTVGLNLLLSIPTMGMSALKLYYTTLEKTSDSLNTLHVMNNLRFAQQMTAGVNSTFGVILHAISTKSYRKSVVEVMSTVTRRERGEKSSMGEKSSTMKSFSTVQSVAK